MESAAVARFSDGTMMMGHSELCFPPGTVVNRASLKTASFLQVLLAPRTMKSSLVKRRGSVQPYIKASESSAPVTSNGKTSQGGLKTSHNESTFPTGFEALVLDVCDETNIAELKVKVGDFEMHLKRNIGSAVSSVSTAPPFVSPSIAPPIPSEPMFDSSPVATQPGTAPSKPSSAPSSSSAYVSSLKDSKLAVLAASGLSGYALVSSPKVGYFRSGRTVKGVKQPPSCKEGVFIKEGQVIGYLDQFGNELPIKSDIAGEVLKVLFKDGEPVGYGDPLVAVLPSFHGIE